MSLWRAAQRLNHLTMGSRYLSKTALFGRKTRSSAMSPLRHRSLFGAEKCAKGLEKQSRKSDLAPGRSRIGARLVQVSSCGRGVPSAFDRHLRPIHRLMPRVRSYRTLRHFGQFIASCPVGDFIRHFQFVASCPVADFIGHCATLRHFACESIHNHNTRRIEVLRKCNVPSTRNRNDYS